MTSTGEAAIARMIDATNTNHSGVQTVTFMCDNQKIGSPEPTADWSHEARYESNVSCSNIKDLSQLKTKQTIKRTPNASLHWQTGRVVPLIAGAQTDYTLLYVLLFSKAQTHFFSCFQRILIFELCGLGNFVLKKIQLISTSCKTKPSHKKTPTEIKLKPHIQK